MIVFQKNLFCKLISQFQQYKFALHVDDSVFQAIPFLKATELPSNSLHIVLQFSLYNTKKPKVHLL